ncbi:6,7-dimethyl-8-ribityllumazine synthase [Caldicellulosiruptor morganii]|uniref:6,7-dimethyl-8-ribityllumazine synthase n=1 Tax=Caldicellulosiruptor morganii TaxID=1387555 RepID=A0ABY7BRQ4_9FIRM|nr:6,7-dimethyl-8-ribityllumazine synthase [Caldicellulosiruptor morganii]WAM34311.1 6,7-dimethyl-8-ribityllumazine synthase [Caldicellulosiruptor morganii]
MKIYEGSYHGEGLKFAVVVSRFNSFITDELLKGCLDALKRHGVLDEDIEVFYVPGAFEIPLAAKKLAKSKKYSAIIALGAVIRGATPHFEYVSAEVSKGVANVSLEQEIPVIFGVLTCDTVDQAIERSGTKAGNKGFDAGLSALEMANLMRNINEI